MTNSVQARGRRRRTPYSWLGAGVLGLGVGVALAGGAGVAHADSAAAGDTSASASSGSASAGVGRAARGPSAATGHRLSGSVSSGVSARSVVASARRASVVKPTPADVEARVAQFQVQLAHSFHDARELVSATLPGPVGGAVNDALYLVRRLVLPTGEHVGIHGTAECVAAKDCSGKDLTGAQLHDQDLNGVDWTGVNLTHVNFRTTDFSASAAGPLPAASRKVAFRYGYFPGMGPLNPDNPQLPPNFNIAKIPPDFSNANLNGADFRNANLNGANFTNANLTNANLTGATVTGANFAGANLTGARYDYQPGGPLPVQSNREPNGEYNAPVEG